MTRTPTGARTSRAATRTRANVKRSPSPPRRQDPDLGLEIMTITPELAQEWLDRGGTNRKITRHRIEAMTAAIVRGEWQLTGEAILHAIVQAGIPVRSVVAHGVSEDALGADRLVRDSHAPLSQQLLGIAQAQAEAGIQPPAQLMISAGRR